MMMVLLRGGVESWAKIAMTPLLNGSATMGLLPNDVPPRLIFPGTGASPDLLILELGNGTRAGGYLRTERAACSRRRRNDELDEKNLAKRRSAQAPPVIGPSRCGLIRVSDAEPQSLIGKK